MVVFRDDRGVKVPLFDSQVHCDQEGEKVRMEGEGRDGETEGGREKGLEEVGRERGRKGEREGEKMEWREVVRKNCTSHLYLFSSSLLTPSPTTPSPPHPGTYNDTVAL